MTPAELLQLKPQLFETSKGRAALTTQPDIANGGLYYVYRLAISGIQPIALRVTDFYNFEEAQAFIARWVGSWPQPK